MKISKKEALRRRKRLLVCGITLFRKRGYASTSVEDITDSADIPKGSFYNYFKNKEEFAAQALLIYSDAAKKHVLSYLDRKDLPALERIINMYRQRIELEKKCIRTGIACLGNMIGQEVGGLNPEIRSAAENLWTVMKRPLTETLQELTFSSRSQSTSSELAEFLENSWRGTMLAARARHSTEPLKAFLKFIQFQLKPFLEEKGESI